MSSYYRSGSRWLYSGWLVCLACLSAGCATTDNPAEGGVLETVYALHTGAYERRLQQQKGVLGSQQQAWADNHRQRAGLEGRRAASQATLGRLSGQIREGGQLESAYKARLFALSQQRKQQSVELESLQQASESVGSKALQQQHYAQQQEQRLESLRQERDALRKQLELLIRQDFPE